MFDSLDVIPDIWHWRDAEKADNKHYVEHIEQKATELGLDRKKLSIQDSHSEAIVTEQVNNGSWGYFVAIII